MKIDTIYYYRHEEDSSVDDQLIIKLDGWYPVGERTQRRNKHLDDSILDLCLNVLYMNTCIVWASKLSYGESCSGRSGLLQRLV